MVCSGIGDDPEQLESRNHIRTRLSLVMGKALKQEMAKIRCLSFEENKTSKHASLGRLAAQKV